MKPEEMLKKTQRMAEAMEELADKDLLVGLPQEEASGVVYGDGTTVLQVGIWHEFGFGDLPQRSFLRASFITKDDEVKDAIEKQWRRVVDGADVEQALGILGVIGVNIVKGAFTSGGYGEWPDIEEATRKRKGSSQVLINTGLLRNSNTWVIR